MINSNIEYQIRRRKFFDSKRKQDRSFKTLSKKWKCPEFTRINLPDTKIYPAEWTYLVSNEKHAHTITLEEFRKKELKEGDKIYFERGQIYNWAEYNLTVNNVSFGSYGSGVDPIFRGSDPSVTFTSEAGGYYSMPLAIAPLWVINPAGQCARQGESEWITTTANATATTITASAATLDAYNAVETLTTAKFRHKEFNFRLSYEHRITGYSAGVITDSDADIVGGASGLPLKLYGQKQYSTLEGDWWFDDANDKLWIKTASDPTGLGWRVITKNYAFKVTGDNVTIDNIEFTQYFESAIEADDAASLTLTNISVHDNRQNGWLLYGNTTTITASNFTIQRCGLQGIHLGAVGASTISNFTINEIGEQDNIGWPVDTYWIKTGGCAIAYFWDSAEARTTALAVDVTLGTIANCGYMGILMVGDDHDITKNVVHDFCTRWNDGGGIYTIHRATLGASTKNVLIQDNIVYNGIGNIDGIGGASLSPVHAEGLYVDNGCELITLDGNTSYSNSDRGCIVNWDTQKTTLTNNIFYGNAITDLIFREDTDPADSPVFPNNDGNVMTGNVFASIATQYCVEILSRNNNANYNPFSDSGSTSGNYYVRPYGNVINISRATSGGAITTYTLSAWATKYGETGGTEKVSRYNYMSPVKAVTEIVLATNPTNGTINVDPADGFEDLDGVAITNFNLGPFESKVYLITTGIAPNVLLDTFTAANGTNIAGRSPDIGPVPTITAGSHEIQNNRMITTAVGGIVYWGMGGADFSFTSSSRVTSGSPVLTQYYRYTNSTNHLIVATTATTLKIFERNNSSTAVELASAVAEFAINVEYYLTAILSGSNMKVYVDGVLYFDITVNLTTGVGAGILGGTATTADFVQAVTP